MPENKSIRRLEEKMAGLEPGTLRHEVLESAKRFKSSWIELGRALWSVQKEKKFREWGYLTFEAYCIKEVGIRAATAQKLLHSYFFLEKEEPTALKRLLSDASPAQLPSPESVQILRSLKNRTDLPADDYERVRTYVLEKGKEAPEIRREVRSLLESAQPRSEEVESARAQSAVRRMVGTLKAIRQQLSGTGRIPKKILEEVDGVVKKLEALLSE